MTTATKTAKQLLEEKQALIEQLKKQQEQLKILNNLVGNTVRVEINKGGGLTIYGLGGRFPINMYVQQFEKFVENIETIKQFVQENNHKLSRKEVKPFNPEDMGKKVG